MTLIENIYFMVDEIVMELHQKGFKFVAKLIMKLVFIGLGLLMLILGYLEYKHWILVNWTVAENQSSTIMTHVANKIASVTQHMNHEIPIGVGVLGFMPGLVLGLYKG